MSKKKDTSLNISYALGVAIGYGLLVFINIFSPVKFYTLDWTTINLLMFIAPVSVLPVFFGFRKFGIMTMFGYYIGLIVVETFVYMDKLESGSTEALVTWAIHLAVFTVVSIFMEIFAYKKRKRIAEHNNRVREEKNAANNVQETATGETEASQENEK